MQQDDLKTLAMSLDMVAGTHEDMCDKVDQIAEIMSNGGAVRVELSGSVFTGLVGAFTVLLETALEEGWITQLEIDSALESVKSQRQQELN